MDITIDDLLKLGLEKESAEILLDEIKATLISCVTAEAAWEELSKKVLAFHTPFPVHLFIFKCLFPNWFSQPELAPAWLPTANRLADANISQFMADLMMGNDVKRFHHWTVKHYQDFWQKVIEKLNIQFSKQPEQICDLSKGIETPQWFPGAKLNIVDSCFTTAPANTAIIFQDEDKTLKKLTFAELDKLSNRVANSLKALGLNANDGIAIVMPMNAFAVTIYLGIIKMGGVVVSIADSFSSEEIALRINISRAKAVFTQDFNFWNGKKHNLYEKIQPITNVTAIVLPAEHKNTVSLRKNDFAWETFLLATDHFQSVPCNPMTTCNILFSSGTTATPKAIPWNHTTGIKAASDAYFHQDIHAGDILAWPTNLGWMMGPWLIYAAFINHAAIALFTEAPKDKKFGEFVQQAGVTMLGVVPTLVAGWRQTKCMEGLDWKKIKVFSSTGESSNPEDMLYLMSLAGYKPIIEYCGGTEIGGSYLSSTVIQKNYPALFSTPAMGLDIVILDEAGKTANVGQVAIIPPSLGLSTTLLNADHYQVYFANMPKIAEKIVRRHGDQIKRLANGYYSILGRTDDTMNLGGIKVSAAEIERAIAGLPDILESAAIAIAANGPSQLIIYAVTHSKLDKKTISEAMQKKINTHLNPLFKIHDVVFVRELPKTASNKILRRVLRDDYSNMSHGQNVNQ